MKAKLFRQEQSTAWIDDGVLGQSLPRLEGPRIGPYQVFRQLGEGGMGKVFLATRENAASKLVALKTLRSERTTEETLRRFRRERQILESLDHPNIARILDNGTTGDGLPYLVMDYVDGQPIDKYCDERHLDLDARLALFRDVCSAVHFAHEHRIVHRDLKPTNILVTNDGVVKLLDFGISKLAVEGPESPTAMTCSDLQPMTPEYASPEQVSGLPSLPATDVYALGVVLYELLTGRRPYRMRSRVFPEMVRVICEETPTRPSIAIFQKADGDEGPTPEAISRLRGASMPDLKKRLTGNIDCILMKTLEKAPGQRYRSVRQLEEDLQRHLEGGVVEARRQAFIDASARYARCNWWWLSITAALAVGLLTSIIKIPVSVLFATLAITGVFTVAYCFAIWQRGKPYARRAVTDVMKFLPIVGIATALEYRAIPWIDRHNQAALYILSILLLLALVGNWWNLFGWYSRDKLGPLILELTPRYQRVRSWLGLAVPIVLFAVVARGTVSNGGEVREILWTLLGFTLASPLFVLISLPRVQFRQRGFVGPFGMLCFWTSLISYSWETGGGRLAGKCDTLFLRFKGGFPTDLKISVENREKVSSLLEQQAFEWPEP